ncbi:similar to Saccharomyces cerevisiae YNL052W COX5A Subunit Va of cytochrome c oxidase, which is the terminal member of the mitochondrial inner membrane electron transport chain [Geotrichum candidum]|nr:similar to Saccharomyces cerevisiae YNL052W COX5A Subunit Va of cytochrome c oxidase, which is the terminal member of the mitochondrial inner membrane electron transport chain [Geotrichum candidum]
MLRSTIRPSRQIITRAAANVRMAHAISNPTIINLESRWEKMTSEEQEDIISQLAERQKGPWNELTPNEKRAAWYISYGSWGPRKPIHPEGEGKKIAFGIVGIVAAAGIVFSTIRYFSEGLGITMNREWQEASDEILKENNANPFRGYSQVQSPPKAN